MKSFTIYVLVNVVLFATFVSSAPSKDQNASISFAASSQQKQVFCGGIDLTELHCPPGTDASDNLCSAVCYLASKLPTEKRSAHSAATFLCPLKWDKGSLSVQIKGNARSVLDALSVDKNCSLACDKEPKKCASISQLVGAMALPPESIAIEHSQTKPKEAQDVQEEPVKKPIHGVTKPSLTSVNRQTEKSAESKRPTIDKTTSAVSAQTGVAAQQDKIQTNAGNLAQKPEESEKLPTVSEPPKAPEKPNNVASAPTVNSKVPILPSDTGRKGNPLESKEQQGPNDFANTNGEEEEEDDAAGLDDTEPGDLPPNLKPSDVDPGLATDVKPNELKSVYSKSSSEGSQQINTAAFVEAEDSHFFIYFLTFACLTIIGYIAFHNKNKILALALEGRRGSRSYRRRPNSASYRKLDTSLEEAMMSHPSHAPTTHVIY